MPGTRRRDDAFSAAGEMPGRGPIKPPAPSKVSYDAARVRRLAFVLLPKFSLVTLGCATEPFRLANQRHDTPPFAYRMLGVEPGPVETNDGLRIATDGVVNDGDDDWSVVFLISSLNAVEFENPKLAAWLRRLSRAGVILAPIGAATVFAARLGLLDDHRCVTHFRLYAKFIERFPKVRLERGLYCIDGKRLTCAGGFAATDLCLKLVADVVNPDVARDVAEIAMLPRIRSGAESQLMSVHWRYGVNDRRVATAIELMESHIETPMALPKIARRVGVSDRHLRRLFVDELGILPLHQYVEIRLRRGNELLLDTDEPLPSIALKCGFSDAAQFSRAFSARFRRSPSMVRRNRTK